MHKQQLLYESRNLTEKIAKPMQSSTQWAMGIGLGFGLFFSVFTAFARGGPERTIQRQRRGKTTHWNNKK